MTRREGRHGAAGGTFGAGRTAVGDPEAPPAAGDLAAERDALRQEVAVLRETMAARAAFDMACGIVMAMGRCSEREATAALLEVARRTGADRTGIARLLVEGIGGPGTPAPVREALRGVLERLSEARGASGRGTGR